MDGLAVAASAAGIISLGIQATTTLVDFYSAYNSQKSDVAYTVKKLDQLLGVLETLRNEVANRKFRPDEQDVLKKIEASVQGCQDCIEELQGETTKFHSRQDGGIRAAAMTAAYRVTYPLRQSTLLKLDENIEETVSHLSLALQLLHQRDVGRVQDDIEHSKALLDLLRADQISSDIITWLRAPDAAITYNEACKKKYPNTGLWFVKGPSFCNWLNQPNSFLWLHGFAGCGKSVLCSTAIQFVLRHRRSNPSIGIAFFFFTFNDVSKQDTSAMLRTLVFQLSCQQNDGHKILSAYNRNAMPSDQALKDCLHQLVRAFDHTYILLDALDESPRDKHRPDVLQTLADMRAWSTPGLHLLVTSRDEPDIRDELDASQDQAISLKNASVDNDIAGFVSGHLRNNRRLRKWEDHHSRIETVLAKRANGVFRWVECQFKALETCPQCEALLDELLESLPQSLDETYERMLSNISPTSIEYARRVLTLLCCAKRPLTVPELIDATAVELGDHPKFNPKRRLQNVDAIHQVCPGFIEVDVDSGSRHWSTVRIAHFSVQEYLESERIRKHTASIFSVRSLEAHSEIASICLTYLSEPGFLDSGDEEVFPLARYAANEWPHHYHDGDKTLYQLEVQAARLFRNAAGELTTWERFWAPEDIYRDHFLRSPVYYASALGLDSVLVELLSEEHPDWPVIESTSFGISYLGAEGSGRYHESLQLAAFRGHEAVVRLLLDNGADIHARGGYFGTVLQAASSGGYETVVRLLLDNGADIHARGGYFGTVLQAASSGGYETVIRLLLDHGADINAIGGYYGTALQTASYKGHETVVRRLLENGADINGSSGRFGTALQAASVRGYETIVRLLLDKGADINAKGGYHGTALQAASLGGDETVVRQLLEKGADINAKGGRFGTALQAASIRGYETIVRQLLEKGADINAKGGYHGTALQAASSEGYETIVRLLLDNGADIHIKSGFYGTALQAASFGGHETVIRLLLDSGADINAEGNSYGTALQVASLRGDETVVRLLLDNGADINAKGGYYGTALQTASYKGHETVVRRLLENGADINGSSGRFGTALQAASVRGYETIVRLLLDKGADSKADGLKNGGDQGYDLEGWEDVLQLS